MNDKNMFSSKEKQVISYILNYPNQIQKLTCRELARNTNVSPPTVLRMIRKLDIDCYHDFKLEVVSLLEEKSNNTNLLLSRIDREDDIHNIVVKMSLLKQAVINEINDTFSYEEVYEIANIIYKSQKIDLYGEGIDYQLNKMMVYYLTRLGKQAVALNHTEDRVNRAFTTKKGHTAIILSHSGTRKSVNQIAKLAKKNQAYIIALTSQMTSTLVSLADKTIYVNPGHHFDNLSTIVFVSSVSHVYHVIIGVLYARCCEEIEDKLTEFQDLSKYGK